MGELETPPAGLRRSLPVPLVGDGLPVTCADGRERPYLSCDAAASTAALPAVLAAVEEFVPWYSSVHRGAGYKSQMATRAYEAAREAAWRFAGGGDGKVAIVCRNTTEAINHLVYRLRMDESDVVVSTVVEHHANMLPWSRAVRCRYVDCAADGTFGVDDVVRAIEEEPSPRLLAITGASNITGWMPPLEEIIDAAHDRGVLVAVDGAQLAPHRRLPASADFLAWSGHKMYAPFGAGALVGERRFFEDGDPFLAGGGAVDLVSLDEVVWTEPPEREEAGSPNVVGAVALGAAIGELEELGWEAIVAHDRLVATALRTRLAGIGGVKLLGPDPGTETLPVATFTLEGMPHALVAARLAAEDGIGVRHGCFCAHPYLMRLLGLGQVAIEEYRSQLRRGDRSLMPGAVRASLGINGSLADVERLCAAIERLAGGDPPQCEYVQDDRTGDFAPRGSELEESFRMHGSACSPG